MTEIGKFCRKRSQRRAHAPARGVGVPATGMGGLGSPETVEVIGSTDLSKTLTNSQGLKSPIIYQGKEVDSMILDNVIKDLNVQDRKTANFMHNMNTPWENPLEVFEEPYLCFPLRNLFLYFPGCISVDEKGNRVFVSDSNHHRIIVFDANGEILDSIGSSPVFEDGDFESAKLMRPAAFFYHVADNCLYIADSELADLMDPRFGLRGFPRNCERYGSHCQGTSLLVACYYIINFFLYTEGFSNISEICGHLILEKSDILKQIPNDLLKQLMHTDCSLEGIQYAGLISSIATFQDDLIICNTGKVDIKLSIEIPKSFELVEPLSESCIWLQARGAATVVSEAERISTSEKVCAAQQWYDELDHRTFWESELESNKVHSSTESSVEVLSSSSSEVVPEGKVLIDCCINTSPGTSEVIISAALYLKLRKTADTDMDSREQKAAKIADSLDPTRRVSKDLLVSYLLASKRDLASLLLDLYK
nr:uncharacterized protein LOC109190975 isoform X4 [Ipomoea batatas]